MAQILTTFDRIVKIIVSTVDYVDEDEILITSHMFNDLGIDSLDMLDIAFYIDKEFEIKIPLEAWTNKINDGKVTSDYYFRMDAFCDRIDELAFIARKEEAEEVQE